jgi:hypothetical protein
MFFHFYTSVFMRGCVRSHPQPPNARAKALGTQPQTRPRRPRIRLSGPANLYDPARYLGLRRGHRWEKLFYITWLNT